MCCKAHYILGAPLFFVEIFRHNTLSPVDLFCKCFDVLSSIGFNAVPHPHHRIPSRSRKEASQV